MPAAPVVMDFYSRYMAGVFDEEQFIAERTAGQAFFGRAETNSETVFSPNANDVTIEIIRSNQKLAALVPRGTVGRFIGPNHADVQINQWSSFDRTYPLVEEEGTVTADEINYRVAGEGPYENRDRAARLRLLASRLHMKSVKRIIRLNEYLAWQSLTTGKQSALSLTDTTVNIYDFRRNAANTVTPTHGWGNALGVPLTDIDTGCDTILAEARVLPDAIIMGGVTLGYFLASPQLTTNQYANKFYYNLVQVGSDFRPDARFARYVDAGMIPYGKLRTPKGYDLTIFTYPFGYNASNGTYTKYFPDTGAMIFSTEARADRFFGPPERLPFTAWEIQEFMERMGFNPMTPPMPVNLKAPSNVILPESFFVDAVTQQNKKGITIRTQHAPIFATTMTDAFYFMTVGTTS